MESEKESTEVVRIPKGKIGYVNIDMADNGWIVSFDVEGNKKSKFDNCSYQSCKHVFDEDELDEAFEFFKILKIKISQQKYGDKKSYETVKISGYEE